MALFVSGLLPYFAFATFLIGTTVRVVGWLRTPVPFHLTLFPVRKNRTGRAVSVATEFLLCRSLFREDKLLWLWVWLFHMTLVMVAAGHVLGITFLRDQFTLVGLNASASKLLSLILGGATGFIMTVSLCALLCRRIVNANVRRLSEPNNFFELLVLLAVALTGILMYVPGFHADLPAVKAFLAGIFRLQPIPIPHNSPFVIHFLLANLLLLYFPFSHLLHSSGFFVIRAMLVEAPPIYPTPVGNSPRSAFATKILQPDIPVSKSRSVEREADRL
jgi:nitrate reductase gamma subunit